MSWFKKKWQIVHSGVVESWLNNLAEQQYISILKELRLLELCGHQLKLPHSKSLGQGLFELRERRFGLRLYYTFDKGQVILMLLGGNKSSQQRDIQTARELLVQLKEK